MKSPIKYKLLIVSLVFMACLYGQKNTNFQLNFTSYGLGSNRGQTTKIYHISNNTLYASFFSKFKKDGVDTIYNTDYVFEDTIFRRDTLIVPLRKTSIDSISSLVESNDTIIETNPCIRSGSLYTLDVKVDSRSQLFKMYNSFDSTAFHITNIVQSYFPKYALDPRPIDLWKTAQRCWGNRWEKKKRLEGKE